MIKFKITFILTFFTFFTFAQIFPTVVWQKTVGGNNTDDLSYFSQVNDGGFILGGTSFSGTSGDKSDSCRGSGDYWVVKLNATGYIEWDKTVGGNYDDYLFSMQQTIDHGYILGGTSGSDSSGDKTDSCRGSHDYWIVKLDSAGNIQWQKTFGGASTDELYTLQQTTDGGYIFGGSSRSNISGEKNEDSRGSSDYWIVKTDSLGNIQWQKTIGGSSIDELRSLQQSEDEGYILGGYSHSDISGEKTENSRGLSDYWVLKIDSVGTIQWQKTIGSNASDFLLSLQQTTDGGYIMGGSSNSDAFFEKTENSKGGFDYWIVKIDTLGNIQWQKTIGGSLPEEFCSINQDFDHGYFVGGWSYSNISGDKNENSRGWSDYWVVKTDSVGNILWQKTLGCSTYEFLTYTCQTTDGNYLLGGYTDANICPEKSDNSNGSLDYWVLELAAPTGIEQNKNLTSDIFVYPNPSNGNFTIHFKNNISEKTIQIFDVTGNIIYQKDKIKSSDQEINLISQPKSIYFLKVFDKDMISVSKIIIQ